jgi:hypothetical protein
MAKEALGYRALSGFTACNASFDVFLVPPAQGP